MNGIALEEAHADGILFVNTAVKGQPRAKQVQVERARAIVGAARETACLDRRTGET